MPNPTDELATPSKRKAASSIPGRAGVFAQLVSEHQEAAALFRQLLASPADEAKLRRNLWAELGRSLVAHERAELREVYNAFEPYPKLRSVIDEHAHQANRLETLVDELNAVPIQTQIWRLNFQRLDALFKQHMLEEEAEFFPLAQEVMGQDKAELLRVPYLSAKRQVLKAL